MPTENRSSNTDPRDVFIRLNPLGLGEAELRKDSTGFVDQRTHSDYLLFLAGYRESHPEPRHHAEPIAWMVGTAIWWHKDGAERDYEERSEPMIPLGPCDSPSEIARVTAQFKEWQASLTATTAKPPTSAMNCADNSTKRADCCIPRAFGSQTG
ncbi:hypothetical protein ACF8Q9_22430 [Pseudomonas sp. TYF_15]|uniref:hypothetical protein n=1 Tax=Pseudomonas sp. TYF_15 TaxID=3367194 RepID=UPI00370C4584